MKKVLPPSGFTLIELLVVVSIISILSLIGLTVYGNAQKSARDAKRKADVTSIAKAYEANYVQNSITPYPIPQVAWFGAGDYPRDPQGDVNYWWNGAQLVPTTARSTFTICAVLENANGNSSTNGDGTTFTAASGATATKYCAKNLQ